MESLPVNVHANRIISAVERNDVVIIVGETGSGKTTQVPQILVDTYKNQRVVVSQPRRVAAVTVATRVADERECPLGEEVGYAVRFDDKSSANTTIKYVTEGVLLREAAGDGLSKWDWIIVDEVHERSVNGDLVMGLVKGEVQNKDENGFQGKLIVMSATTDVNKLEKWFSKDQLKVGVVNIPGRLWPVQIMYTSEAVPDFVDGAVTAALQVHVDYSLPGDILVFLPGQDEIVSAISLFRERVRRYFGQRGRASVIAYPLYASLPHEEQMRAINDLPSSMKSSVRKIIFSTNVAETSITIKGVRYVIDSGVAKVRGVRSERGLYADILRTEPISKAQVAQRSGRAGRTSAGMAFRLYTESEHTKLNNYPTAEVVRADAASSILQILALGKHPVTFDFLDKPPRRIMERGLETLYALGAVDEEMKFTKLGEIMSQLPVAPMLSRCLLECKRFGCVEMGLTLVSMLSVEGGIFFTPQSKREVANAARRRFIDASGDHLTLIAVFNEFCKHEGRHQRAEFCKDHYLNERTLNLAVAVRQQLAMLIKMLDGNDVKNFLPPQAPGIDAKDGSLDALLRCIISGFFRNAARKRPDDGKYTLIGGAGGYSAEVGLDIHPSSSLRLLSRKRNPEWVVFDELVMTSKPYLRNVSAIEKSWLVHHSNQYYEAVVNG